MRILVSHPHSAAFSAGLAVGLALEDRLATYLTGVAGVSGTASGRVLAGLARRWPVLTNRIQPDTLDGRLRPMGLVELTARGMGAAAAVTSRDVKPYEVLFVLHDRAVSLRRWPSDARVVYAYEDAALATFERARTRGLWRVWDLPLPHYEYLARMWQEEARRWPELAVNSPREPARKLRRKDAELELCQAVSVASAFTRSTLPKEPTRPVVVIPYGFPVDAFAPKARTACGPFVALSVGSQNVRKGTHYLLRAWKNAGLRDGRLRLVGPMGLPGRFLEEFAGLFEHVPHVPRARLAEEYQAADLLVFPTLGDGFGLVIQEAMCSGTPVLTTPCGGGPECITDGVEGWIVPAKDEDALTDRIREAASDRERLARMGQAARRRAEKWTWHDAACKLVSELTHLGML